MKKGPLMPGKYSPCTDMCGSVGTAKNQHTAVAAFMAHRNLPTLPNGDIVDAKNINHTVSLPPVDNAAPFHPTFTQWRKVIHAKNINQRYTIMYRQTQRK
jgi:hypothetical protein